MRAVPSPCLLVVLLATLVGAGIGSPGAAGAQTIQFVSFPDKVGSGLQSTVVLANLSDSQHGGITMHIESADTFLAFVSDGASVPGTQFVDIFIPNGTVQAQFYVQALEDTTGTVTVTASAPGFANAVDSTDVVQPGMRLFGLAGAQDVSAPRDDFQIQVGIPNGSNTNLSVFQPARAGGPGLTVTVSHDNAAAAQLVTQSLTAQVVTVVIVPSQNISPPNVSLGGVALDGIGSGGVTEVTASIPGFIATSADTATVTLTPSFITMSGTPLEVGSGLQAAQKRVYLSGSEHGGVTVHVESSDSMLALVAPTSTTPGSLSVDLVIPNGSAQANFYISAPEDTLGTATITASATGFISGVENVDVVTPAYRIYALAPSIDVFDPPDVFLVEIGLPKPDLSTLKIAQAVRAGGVPLTVELVSSDSLVGKFALQEDTLATAYVPINVGAANTPGSLFFGGVAFDGLSIGTTQVKASIPGFVSTAAGSLDVMVTEPGMVITNLPNYGVGSGLQSGAARVTLGASAHGGKIVTVWSEDSTLALLAEHPDSLAQDSLLLFVPNNQTIANFYIHGLEDTTGTATISASADGFSGTNTTVDIVQPGVRIYTDLAGTIDTIDPPDEFRVNIGAPNNPGTSVLSQNVRTGGVPVVVTLTVDDSLLASLPTLADTSHTATVIVDIGESFSPTTVATGGVALDGLSPGVVTVSASAPGFLTVPEGQKAVTVSAPTINVTGLFSAIGAGLQSHQLIANLSAGNHGGITLHVETSDTTVALVADGPLSAGSEFVDIFVPNGVVNPVFRIQGVDSVTGGATVTVSAPGFVSTQVFPTVVQPAVDIYNLAATIDVGDPADEFVARVGIPISGNAYVQFTQERRGGAPPLVVTVASDDTLAAKVTTTSTTGDTVTVQVAAGQDRSPALIENGGVGLMAIAEGQAIVFASIPGFIQTGNAQWVVDVTNTTIVYQGLPARLGAGLETNVVTAKLGNSSHGGVSVHIQVDDTLSALVSTNALVVGGESVDVPVLNGATEAPFYLQALDGVTDTVTVTASATGFTANAQDVAIVSPALEIFELADSFQVGDPDDEFYVAIGALRADGSGIYETQLVRPGGTPVLVSVTTSDTLVGRMETLSTSGDTASATIGIGVGQTPATVGAGGMAFNPEALGASLVEATAPGFYTSEAGSSTVYVVSAPSGVRDGTTPPQYALEQNYPNPFNPTTTIRFVMPASAHAELAIFDVLGRRVVTLLDRAMPGGAVAVTWDGRDQRGKRVSSGVYFYRLRAGTFTQSKRMVLLK